MNQQRETINPRDVASLARVGSSTRAQAPSRRAAKLIVGDFLYEPRPTDVAYWKRRLIGGGSKRVFDVFAAGAGLVFLAPILGSIMLLIKLQDGGPVFYRHERVGQGGRRFGCLKFRSMRTDSEAALRKYLSDNPEAAAEWARSRKLLRDPRITPIGRVLRSTSLDELPQLLNVIRGEMSLVGPRPVVSDELAFYGLSQIHYLSARPGLTGLWQVSGRSDAQYAKRVALDASYVTRWSMWRDLGIILKTVPALLLAKGAY